ncbi:MAG: 5'-nucleotidase C-terminal domain-containing protein [Alphaproteobacteria bacterium]|nr:5'-nucleotidase C-terminal domain-containing protein [Alphaproteobacteria bacterium]
MNAQDNDIDIFALTDSHQEARKLCCLFSGIIANAKPHGRGALILDCGDLFKGIYDRQLCVDSYLKLRRQLPEAKIVIAVGNNDFGFNHKDFAFLQETASQFNKANIHILCANLRNNKSGTYPKWVDPYILLNINGKKIMVTAFCINQIRLQRYGIRLVDIPSAFLELEDTIKYIAPDALIVLNHALEPSSRKICELARQHQLPVDLVIGGHEHSLVAPDAQYRIYYPQAFSRTMWHLKMQIAAHKTAISKQEELSCKAFEMHKIFEPDVVEYEEKSGLNIPIARSTLNLERNYAAPSPLGTFITDVMKEAAHATIGILSTGYIIHALRYEEGKMLTHYNLERAFSADVPLQTVAVHPAELKAVFENAVRNRYIQKDGNTRFLQCSQNLAYSCFCDENNEGHIKQIYINGDALLNEEGKPLHPEHIIVCAVDPFVGAGEQGFDVLRHLGKETIMRDNQMVKIKELFIQAVKDAEHKYKKGSSYPSFKIIDLSAQ